MFSSHISKVVQHVLAFLSELAGTLSAPTVSTLQALGTQPFDTIARIEGALGTNSFFNHSLVPVMNGIEHEMLTKFLKLKPALFRVTKSKDALPSSWIAMRDCIN